MSYDKTIDSLCKVTFDEEESYLNCRLQYLEYCKDAVMPEVTFIQYIRDGRYYENCVVENIEPQVLSPYVPTENSFAVGNDSGSIPSGSLVFGQFANGESANGQDVHISGNLIVSGVVASNNIVGTTVASFGQADLNNDVYSTEYAGSFEGFPYPSNPVSDKESFPKESPSDPIENRWDILDLRGDGNGHG